MAKEVVYNEDSIRTLEWHEHIRLRPGMYIGKLGDGSSADDGIYILLKETLDNCIDEFVMGNGKTIDVSIKDKKVKVRDYGRGIPLGKLVDVVSKINTGAKYDSAAFKKSFGLNGVGTKAVNALSSYFKIESFRDDKSKLAEFSQGKLKKDEKEQASDKRKGTLATFIPDEEIFGNYQYRNNYIEKMLWNYVYLNRGLTINFNGQKFHSENGLLDLLNNNIDGNTEYTPIHIEGYDIEVAMTHSTQQYGEEYYSFVNGQHTTQGGTHQGAFREGLVKTIREFFKKDFEAVDVRASIIAAVSIKVEEPVFESQTKTKLGSQEVSPKGKSVKAFVGDFLKKELDNFLHKNTETAQAILQKILQRAKKNIQKLATFRFRG